MVLFTGQGFKNSLQWKVRPRICFKIRGWVIQTHVCQAFESLRENQSLTITWKSLAKRLKSLPKWLKSLTTCLRYNTPHGVPISHGKAGKKLVFSRRVKCYKDFVGNYFVRLSMLSKIISSITKHLLLLYLNTYLQRVSLDQLTSSNSCLLMHSILVRINGLKYNLEKQKSIWLNKIFG